MQETVNSYDDRSYLFIRPVSENAVSAESFVEKLPSIPGLDKADLETKPDRQAPSGHKSP